MNGKESATLCIEIPNPESLFIFSIELEHIVPMGLIGTYAWNSRSVLANASHYVDRGLQAL